MALASPRPPTGVLWQVIKCFPHGHAHTWCRFLRSSVNPAALISL